MELDRGARFREKAVRMVTRVSRGETLSLLMGASDLIRLRRVQASPVLPVVGKVPVAYGRARAKSGLRLPGPTRAAWVAAGCRANWAPPWGSARARPDRPRKSCYRCRRGSRRPGQT